MTRHCAAFVFVCALAMPAAAFAQDGLAPGDSPGPQVFFSTSCKVKRILATSENASTSTGSTVPVNVPGGSISFTTPGTVPSCVQVDFSAMTFAAGGDDLVLVRALLDGAVMQPGQVQLGGDDDEDGDGRWSRSHNHQWIGNVNPGPHTVTMQFWSFDGGLVNLHTRTLTVTTK